MKRKIKYLTAILLFVFLFYTLKTSYSRFNTQVEGEINNNNNNLQFAGFAVNSEITDSLDFEIKDMMPGDTKEIRFSVKNYKEVNKNSDVNIKYKIIITSYMLPLKFQLNLFSGANVSITCSGFLGKNCTTDEYQFSYSSNKRASYILTVTYPSNKKDIIFKNNVDNIHIEIESWQVTN